MVEAKTKYESSINQQSEIPHSHIKVGQMYDNSLTDDESSLNHIKQYKKKPKTNKCKPRKIAAVFFIGVFVLLIAFVGFEVWKDQQFKHSKLRIKSNTQKTNKEEDQLELPENESLLKKNKIKVNNQPKKNENLPLEDNKMLKENKKPKQISVIPTTPAITQQSIPPDNNKQSSQIILNETKVINQNLQNHNPSREHVDHQTIHPTYSTLGMPIIGKPFNSSLVNFGADYYLYQSKMDQVFKPFNNTNCEYERYGDSTDGGYVLCKNFINHSAALINLGVQGRDLFGCAVTSEFQMPNYQYDCTNTNAPKCQTNNNTNNFMPICLSDRTQKTIQYTFSSLADLIHSRNLTNKYVTMKIDIEGAQWPGFRTFPTQYLDYVDQLILQIHLSSGSIGYQPVWGNLDIIKSIGEKFISTNLHMNNYACVFVGASNPTRFYPSFAIEVTLVNKKLINVNEPTRSYSLHSKNTPNSYQQDCQLKD